MHTTMTTMMFSAQPHKILSRLNPRTNNIRVTNPRIPFIQQLQINRIQQRKLNMRVMQLQSARALQEIAAILTHKALRGLFRSTLKRIKIPIIRVLTARLMRRIMHNIPVSDLLVMLRNHS